MTLSQALQEAYEEGFQDARLKKFDKSYGEQKAEEVKDQVSLEVDLILSDYGESQKTGRWATAVKRIKELSKAIKLAKEKNDGTEQS